MRCRDEAMGSHHRYECKLSLFFEETQLNRLPLAMMAFRAVTQRPLEEFLKDYDKRKFDRHNVQNGVLNHDQKDSVEEDHKNKQIFYSNDYLNLFNLVTHSERRDMIDIVTKHIFAGILLQCLEAVGYFESVDKLEKEMKSLELEEKNVTQDDVSSSKSRLKIGIYEYGKVFDY